MGTKARDHERRKQQRMSLAIPVRVHGHDGDGHPWEEMSATENADFAGAAFLLRHSIGLGRTLYLSLPLPKPLRRHDQTSASYAIYALVRHTMPVAGGGQRVGVMFLGKNPPKGYAAGGRFLLPTDAVATAAPRERRLANRYDVPVRLKVSRTESGPGPAEEQTVSNNLGPGGAMVYTSLAVTKGERLIIEDSEGALRTLAVVQNVFIGQDGIPRLNLRFLQADATEGVRRVLLRVGISA